MQTLDGPQLDRGPVETVELGKKCVSPKFGFVKKTANILSNKRPPVATVPDPNEPVRGGYCP